MTFGKTSTDLNFFVGKQGSIMSIKSLSGYTVFIFLGLVIWFLFKSVLWIGDSWDGFIDKNHKNEFRLNSEIQELPIDKIEIQWYVKNRVHWLTSQGKFIHPLPPFEGRNIFRIFINDKPIHTFYMNKPRADRKYTFTFELRDSDDEIDFYFGWEPQFYHDDYAGSDRHQMYTYNKKEIFKKINLFPENKDQ